MPPVFVTEHGSAADRQDISTTPSRPNIIVIYTDDQSFGEVGFYNTEVLSPNIDRIFAEGMPFPNARVTTSLCTPSRYGLHTGTYASRGVHSRANEDAPKRVHFNMTLAKETQTIGKVLQRAGYRTGFVGKWHLSGPVEHTGAGSQGNAHGAFLQDKHRQDIKLVKEHGGFDYVAEIYMYKPRSLASAHGLPEEFGTHNPEWLTNGALKFIRNEASRSSGQPFFLMIAPTLVHNPQPKISDDPRITPYGFLSDDVPDRSSRRGIWKKVKDHVGDIPESRFLQRRLLGISLLDDGIGKILAELENRDLLSDTLILFMSDNSDVNDSIYDNGVRVPMAAYWPSVIEPGRSAAPIANIDIFSTIAEMAGIGEPDHPVDGISFRGNLIDANAPSARKSLLLELGYARAVGTNDGWTSVTFRIPANVSQIAPAGTTTTQQ